MQILLNTNPPPLKEAQISSEPGPPKKPQEKEPDMWPKSFFCNGWLLVNNVPGLDTSTHPSKKIEALKPEKKLYQTNWKKEKRFLRFYPPSICSRFVENIHYPHSLTAQGRLTKPTFFGRFSHFHPGVFFAKEKMSKSKGNFFTVDEIIKLCAILSKQRWSAIVDCSEIPNNHLGCFVNLVYNGINYLFQLVQDFFHQQYHVILGERLGSPGMMHFPTK